VDEWRHICNWALENELPINFNKTHVLNIIIKKSLQVSTLLKPDKIPLENVSQTKLLGIILSNNMKWDLHLNYVIPRASKSVFIIISLKTLGVSYTTLWHVYYALTRSILTYGYPAMCNMPKIQFKRLERVERRVTRIIGSYPPVALAEFCELLCKGITTRIKENNQHPLHTIFLQRQYVGRQDASFCASFAKTTRYKDSFIKYFPLFLSFLL
jgi:hypothetical protein